MILQCPQFSCRRSKMASSLVFKNMVSPKRSFLQCTIHLISENARRFLSPLHESGSINNSVFLRDKFAQVLSVKHVVMNKNHIGCSWMLMLHWIPNIGYKTSRATSC